MRGGKKDETGYGKLGFPGGFQESGECAFTAAARELDEETGIRVPELSLRLFRSAYAGVHDVQMQFFLARPVKVPAFTVFRADKPDEVLDYKVCFSPPDEMAFHTHLHVMYEYFSRRNALKYAWHELRRAIRL